MFLKLGDVHWDSNQDVWSELSEEVAINSSRSVVSLAVSDGNTVLSAFSGIAIECQGHVTRFLTSGSLVRALNSKTKDHDNLKVEVHHEGNIVRGFLGEYDLDLGIAVVNVITFLDVQVVHLSPVVEVELLPCSKVVAVGRGICGKLMATSGILTCDSSGSEDNEDLMLSTCKICETWEGGPLFDIEGNFVGMNIFSVKESTVFLPSSIILERMDHFRTSLRRSKFLARLESLKAVRYA
uniref:Uncharacterized protein n=1 Tax=Arundo donax TaxID=35708 RepID=A0A0A9CMB2_ARUDO